MVFVPLIGGIALFGLFIVWESRYRHAMLDLTLFRIRNFAITNLETLVVYAGPDRRPLLPHPLPPADRRVLAARGRVRDDAGLAAHVRPLAALRQDRLRHRAEDADGGRARSSAGVGLLLLTRVDADPNYVADVLPGLILFGLGLSATVAPLTATALDSVEERHSGVASGHQQRRLARRRDCSRSRSSAPSSRASSAPRIDEELAGASISPDAQAVVDEAKSDPLQAAGHRGAGRRRGRAGRGRVRLGRHRRLPPRDRRSAAC